MTEPIWINDIWLTANQWDVVLEAMSQRGTKKARDVGQRLFKQLSETSGYQRHWHAKDQARSGDGV